MNWYYVAAVALIVFLIVIFFVSYVMNKKTDIPENCKDLVNESQCEGCQVVDCALKKIDELKEEIKK